jgi:hypothetical protein
MTGEVGETACFSKIHSQIDFIINSIYTSIFPMLGAEREGVGQARAVPAQLWSFELLKVACG